MSSAPQHKARLSVALLHEGMLDKRSNLVTTSITLIDLHDIARSARTFGLSYFFAAHPSAAMRKLARTLQSHWSDGYGASYNPDRKEALELVHVKPSFDEIVHHISLEEGKPPVLVATSAHDGAERTTFKGLRSQLEQEDEHYLLMLGTGWGMADELLSRSDIFLEPINGPTDYNHLSVRSAAAIMFDRLQSPARN